jgi:L-2-hydroxyglutarate oxidase LhgO
MSAQDGPRFAKAHEQLDREADHCYRKEAFATDRQRVEYLFALYEQLVAAMNEALARLAREIASAL